MTEPGAASPVARRRRWRRRVGVAVALGAYPMFVLTATYAQFFASGLPGGRNGPADAYRHSLASAIVAYTTSPRLVDWVTAVMERGGEGAPGRAMDAHNNRLGARIGDTAPSWQHMQVAVREAVRRGGADVRDSDRITWLPPERWQNRLY